MCIKLFPIVYSLHFIAFLFVALLPVVYAGADLVNWGPQENIGMGPYTFAHIYLDQPWGIFFYRDACNVSTFFMYML